MRGPHNVFEIPSMEQDFEESVNLEDIDALDAIESELSRNPDDRKDYSAKVECV